MQNWFAMVGARRVRGRVVGNLAREIGLALKGSPCQVFHEGMKLQAADDTVLYPDLFVTCDKGDLATEHVFRAPTVVFEVLSPSTPGSLSQSHIVLRSAPRAGGQHHASTSSTFSARSANERNPWSNVTISQSWDFAKAASQASVHRLGVAVLPTTKPCSSAA